MTRSISRFVSAAFSMRSVLKRTASCLRIASAMLGSTRQRGPTAICRRVRPAGGPAAGLEELAAEARPCPAR